MCAGQYWCKRGRTPRSCERLATVAYFATPPVVVNDAQDYNIDTLQANMEHKVEQWNKRESNFNIERVSRFVLSVHPYRSLHGSTFFPRQSSW